jgi:hypothetical protein
MEVADVTTATYPIKASDDRIASRKILPATTIEELACIWHQMFANANSVSSITFALSCLLYLM